LWRALAGFRRVSLRVRCAAVAFLSGCAERAAGWFSPRFLAGSLRDCVFLRVALALSLRFSAAHGVSQDQKKHVKVKIFFKKVIFEHQLDTP